MKNKIGITLEPLSMDDFIAKFRPQVHDIIIRAAARENTSHLVMFECLNMSSHYLGHRTALIIGPSHTYETLEEVAGGHLGATPSVMQYPVAYVKTERG